jgi:nucleoside-diphosphate-sugar epimerase
VDSEAVPLSAYGELKLHQEATARLMLEGVCAVLVGRVSNLYGPGQNLAKLQGLISRLALAAATRQPLNIFVSLDTLRDYIYVDDVVEANLLASRASTPSGSTCNIASGSRRTLLELLQAISAVAGGQVEPIFGPPRPGDIQHSLADISVARRVLGYTVSVEFADGIARTVAWFREQVGGQGW